MNDISSKIYNLMLENNIKEEQIVSYLKNVIDDINISKYENIDINADMFYNRDMKKCSSNMVIGAC